MRSDARALYRLPGGEQDRGELVLVEDGRAYDLGSPGAAGLARELVRDDVPPSARPAEELLSTGRARELPAARAIDPAEPLLPPLLPAEVGKVLALGKNYRAHAEEFGEEVPAEPMFFNKLPETLVGHRATVTVPAWYADRFDHEVELAVVIGRPGRNIAPERAFEHVLGYTVANDLTARTLQGDDRKQRYPWFRAKNFEGSCPLGPCLVLADPATGAEDVADLAISAEVNDERRQDASTAQLVVTIPHALAWLSRHLALHTGDVVLMGTPSGVGPLEDGDEVVCAIEGIGALATHIARPRA